MSTVWPGWKGPWWFPPVPLCPPGMTPCFSVPAKLRFSRPSLSQTLEWFGTTHHLNFDTVGSSQFSTTKIIVLCYSVQTLFQWDPPNWKFCVALRNPIDSYLSRAVSVCSKLWGIRNKTESFLPYVCTILANVYRS